MRILSLFFLMLVSTLAYNQTVITVRAARNLGAGATVTIKGIVTNGPELGTIRYMQDTTAGMALYSSSLANVARGDSIQVTGTLKMYNQLMEMDPVTSFQILSSGNPSPAPLVVVPDSINEYNEARLVEVQGATFNNPGGTFSSNTAYSFSASGQSSTIYVRSGNPLIGTVIPTGPVNLIGLASQYSYSSPNSGYQLICRDTNDIISSLAIAITSPVSLDSLTTSGFVVDWTTDNPGTTEIFYGSTEALGLHMNDTNKTLSHHLKFSGASPSQLFYTRAFSVSGGDTAYAPLRVFITRSLSSGDMKVYFNHPTDHSVSSGTDAITLTNAIDDTLIAYINRAQSSIDFTMYNFNTANIANVATALNNAYNRGVTVRCVFDNGANNTGIQQLDAGIKKISNPTGSQYGIMHNKFIVFDAYSSDANVPLVWTGSTNLTDGQINTDPNSVIIIQDKSLAIAYALEFNEMFGSSGANPDLSNARFGPDKLDNTPHEFIINNKDVRCYFSPSDGTNDIILSEIGSATQRLDIATMLITRSDIAYAIQDAVNNNGVATRVMVNHQNDCSQTVWNILSNLLDTNLVDDQSQPGIMHHKFMVVDEGLPTASTLLGSHNWSNSANNKNDENTLVIFDPAIANQYYQAFKYRFDQNLQAGINGIKTLSALKVWPNPADEALNIRFTSQSQHSYQLILTDFSGKIISSRNIQVQQGDNRFRLNMSSFSPGMYMLMIQGDNGVYVQKIAH